MPCFVRDIENSKGSVAIEIGTVITPSELSQLEVHLAINSASFLVHLAYTLMGVNHEKLMRSPTIQ